jgi:hypothetical protein
LKEFRKAKVRWQQQIASQETCALLWKKTNELARFNQKISAEKSLKNSLYALEQDNKLGSTLEKTSNDPSLDKGFRIQFSAEYLEQIARKPLEISDLLIFRAITRLRSPLQ